MTPVTTTQGATPSIDTDAGAMFDITGQAGPIENMSTNLTGTPAAGQLLIIAVTSSSSTTRSISWGTKFEAGAVPLPTATSSTKRLMAMFVWNPVTSKWGLLATS